MRQVVLDTETTGRETAEGHRIIEIGCIELINRRITDNHYHQYINPQRESEAGALAVHGLTQDFLQNHPLFPQIVDDFLNYIKGAELIIHNAPFDIGFLNAELSRLNKSLGKITDYCTVLDTLPLARKMHPGQRNSLDALCKRYEVDNTHRNLHGALVDSDLLARVYLAMTGGQTTLFGEKEKSETEQTSSTVTTIKPQKQFDDLVVVSASAEELTAHDNYLELLRKKSADGCLWEKM